MFDCNTNCRDLLGDVYDGNPAKSAGFPRGRKLALRESRGNGNKYHGSPARIEEILCDFLCCYRFSVNKDL